MQVVKELGEAEVATALHQRRRIVVLRRDDGNFAIAEQYYYVNEHEGELIAEGWATVGATGIFDSIASAEVEGRAQMARWDRHSA